MNIEMLTIRKQCAVSIVISDNFQQLSHSHENRTHYVYLITR